MPTGSDDKSVKFFGCIYRREKDVVCCRYQSKSGTGGKIMRTLGNILWFLFGGLIGGLAWTLAGCIWCITIIGIPFGSTISVYSHEPGRRHSFFITYYYFIIFIQNVPPCTTYMCHLSNVYFFAFTGKIMPYFRHPLFHFPQEWNY